MKLIIAGLVAVTLTQTVTPQSAFDELLAADRAFAAAAARTTAIPALTVMFADDVVMPTPAPQPGFARGKAQANDALSANPANATSRVEWTPVGGGVSADGRDGFTVGYMSITSGEGKVQPAKYIAYWTRRADGWRVAAYKRIAADGAPQLLAMLAATLPARIESPITDAATLARHRASLEAAEKAFSDEAQKIGLGPAFAKYGSAEAVNIGPRTSAGFVVGAANIARSVGAGSEGKPSPVSWAADEGSIVASSGDLGVTFGFIRQNGQATQGQPAGVPFFTIWHRPSVNVQWRYVAE